MLQGHILRLVFQVLLKSKNAPAIVENVVPLESRHSEPVRGVNQLKNSPLSKIFWLKSALSDKSQIPSFHKHVTLVSEFLPQFRVI